MGPDADELTVKFGRNLKRGEERALQLQNLRARAAIAAAVVTIYRGR
jgi:hypothetical protein